MLSFVCYAMNRAIKIIIRLYIYLKYLFIKENVILCLCVGYVMDSTSLNLWFTLLLFYLFVHFE